VSDNPLKRRPRRVVWIIALFGFLVAAIAVAPFVLTTSLVRLALALVLPGHSTSLGSAALSLSGTMVLRDLVLHDSGMLAREPLITAREVDAEFKWTELRRRQVRQIKVKDVIVYARPNGLSQLSLLDVFLQLAKSAGPQMPNRTTPPLSMGVLKVQGLLHQEHFKGLAQARADLPFSLEMTMSGDRLNPSRRFSVAVGGAPQTAKPSRDGPAAAPAKAVADADSAFGLWAEAETQPVPGGTRVVLHRLTARQSAVTIEADTLRQYLSTLPSEVQGRLEASVATLSASGEIDLRPSNHDHLAGSLGWAGLRMRVSGGSQLILGLDDLGGAAEIDSFLPPGPGTAITVEGLHAINAKVSIEAGTLRRYLARLPGEIQGRIDTGVANLSASGRLELRAPTNGDHLAGSFAFAGVRVRMPGGSRVMLGLDDLDGAAKIDTLLPPRPGTSITIERLQAANAKASVDADTLRSYARKVPTDLHGPVDANFRALLVSGLIASEAGSAMRFRGKVRLNELSVRSPTGGKHAFALDRLTTACDTELRLDRWDPAAVKVDHGETQFVDLNYGINAVTNFDASWRLEGKVLTFDHFAAEIFDGRISGAPQLDLATYAMPRCGFLIESINMHQALANVSPAHLDAEGNASGSLNVVLSKQGDLSGDAELAFDGPGTLRVGQVEEIKQMLVGNFGTDMANLALHDLEHYPFKQGTLALESAGQNSQLKIKFLRQPRTSADQAAPRKEIIAGKEVTVRSLIAPTIDMTIPIVGKSLAEILAIVTGASTLIATVNPQPGK
jgi:hypothetical protein